MTLASSPLTGLNQEYLRHMKPYRRNWNQSTKVCSPCVPRGRTVYQRRTGLPDMPAPSRRSRRNPSSPNIPRPFLISFEMKREEQAT